MLCPTRRSIILNTCGGACGPRPWALLALMNLTVSKLRVEALIYFIFINLKMLVTEKVSCIKDFDKKLKARQIFIFGQIAE